MGYVLLIAFVIWIAYLGGQTHCAHLTMGNAFSCGIHASSTQLQTTVDWAFVAAFIVFIALKLFRRKA